MPTQGSDPTEKGGHKAHRLPSLDGPAVVAYTTEDDEHPEVRHAAELHVAAHGCVLILFAGDVASMWSEAMPNQWGSEGEGARLGDRLSPDDLEFLGRTAIAEQVREGHRAGARTSGWLPKDKGVEALVDYASAQDAHIVFVPDSLSSIDELRLLLAALVDKGLGARSPIELQVVHHPDSAKPSAALGDPGSEPA